MNTRTTLITIIAIGTILLLSSAISAQGPSELNAALARARAATAKYHDLTAALEDGFTLLPPGVCHSGEDGVLGVTYINVPRFLSPEVNEEEPEFLAYIPTGDGNMRLVSVAYTNRVLFRDTRSPDTPGYRAGIFAWQNPVIPSYLEEVSGSFSVFGEQGRRRFEGRWIYLLPVFLWSPNPAGLFADGDPTLHCPE
jgi:hypothetical protein